MTAVFFEIVIIVLLILLNGFFAMSEMAVVSSRTGRLKQMAKEGNRGARPRLGSPMIRGAFCRPFRSA